MRPTRGVPRVLPPALLHRLIVLAGARTPISRLGVPIGLEKETEAVVAPVGASRNADIDRRPAHQEAALGLVVEHRDELGAIVGLAAQRLVRDDDRGSRQCSRRDAIEHILRDGDAVERVLGIVPAARIVPILHTFLEESITRLALQSLLVRTELAGRYFLLRIDCKTRSRR